jgi:hypothetical protein
MNTNKNTRDDKGFTNDMNDERQRDTSRTTENQNRDTASTRSDDNSDRESDFERNDM